MPRSHYDVLQLDSPKATHDEIKRAFRRLSMDLHPDKNGNSEESKRAFQEINEAYNVLGDPEKRGNYDFELQMGHRVHRMGPMGPMGMGINPLDMLFAAMHQQHPQHPPQHSPQQHNPAQHIFEAMFGGNGLGMGMGMGPQIIIHNFTASHPAPTDENECDHIEMVSISLSDAYNGCMQHPINVSYHDDNCNKQTDMVLINVPPRVANGHKIHLKRHGARHAMTIQLNIAEHPVFILEGDDLLVDHRVSLKDALCGFTFELAHLNGRSYKFNCKSCSITSICETKVMPGLGYNETGALKIRFSVELPTSLTEEQVTALSGIL